MTPPPPGAPGSGGDGGPRPTATRLVEGKEADVGKLRNSGGRTQKETAGAAEARGGSARVQSHARLPRLPVGHRAPGDHRNAGTRHFRSRRASGQERHQGDSGSYDSARRLQEGTGAAEGTRAAGGQ